MSLKKTKNNDDNEELSFFEFKFIYSLISKLIKAFIIFTFS